VLAECLATRLWQQPRLLATSQALAACVHIAGAGTLTSASGLHVQGGAGTGAAVAGCHTGHHCCRVQAGAAGGRSAQAQAGPGLRLECVTAAPPQLLLEMCGTGPELRRARLLCRLPAGCSIAGRAWRAVLPARWCGSFVPTASHGNLVPPRLTHDLLPAAASFLLSPLLSPAPSHQPLLLLKRR
jgi:hypothetical protein